MDIIATLRVQIALPVPAVDLAAGGHPDLLARSDIGQSLIEVFAAMRMPDQEWVQANRHDPAGLGAVFIEHIELITDHPAERLRPLALVELNGNFLPLNRLPLP